MSSLSSAVVRFFTNTTVSPTSATKRRLLNTSTMVNRALYGLDCIKQKTDCLGDNHDTNYIHTDRLKLRASDMYVFVGTNCVANGKCTYSNFGIYKGYLRSTPLSVDYRKLAGSAAFFAPGLDPNVSSRLVAYAVARDCRGLQFCLEIGTDVVPSPPIGDWFSIYRTYLEPATKTGPLVTELVMPKLMHFGA